MGMPPAAAAGARRPQPPVQAERERVECQHRGRWHRATPQKTRVYFLISRCSPKNTCGTLDKASLAKSAVEAVRTHKDIAFLAAYAASVASAQPMWPSESTYAGVGQRELRGLQAAETSAPQSWSSARACSQIHALAELSSWRLQVAEPRLAERRSARRELRTSPVSYTHLTLPTKA